MHNIYVLSLAPSSKLVHAHRRSLQRLTGAPWMALNSDVVHSLDELGFGIIAPPVQDLAFATLARAAHSERETVRDGCAWLDVAGLSDDALLLPEKRAFCAGLIVYPWRQVSVTVSERFVAVALDGARGLQRVLMRSLRAEGVDERRAALAATLMRRMQRWDAEHAEELVECIRSAMIGTIPEELRVSLL